VAKQRERHKTITFNEQNNDSARFLCRSVDSYNVKWLNYKFCPERKHTTVNFRFFAWTVSPSLQIQLLDSTASFDKLNEGG